jgi:hypothetical protein
MGRKNNVIQNIDVVDQVKNHPFLFEAAATLHQDTLKKGKFL